MSSQTFFKRVMAIDLSEKTLDAPPVMEGDKVLGVMSEFAQKVFHLRNELFDQHEWLNAALSTRLDEHAKSHDSPAHTSKSCEQFNQVIKLEAKKVLAFREELDNVGKIFWSILTLDFLEQIHSKEYASLAIRENYQVVVLRALPPGLEQLFSFSGLTLIETI